MISISGSGGGGGGKGSSSPRTPVEANDSLQSFQYATVVDLISEGEIEGIEGGERGIYLEDVPVRNANNSPNFTGYTILTENGTQPQNYIPLPTGTPLREVAVGVRLFAVSPVVRTITNSEVDRIRITLNIPALQSIQDNGDIIGNAVDIRIEVQYTGGSYTTVIEEPIVGKTSSRYQRSYDIRLTGTFPVNIRVTRINYLDETSPKRQNETWWSSYTEIIEDKLRYPNSAVAALRFDSRQFSSIPRRKYLVRGIKVRIPNNATVDTTSHPGRLTYTGIWNGTFSAATWTNDPAWCLWDLLTSTRYGAGIPEASLDRYDFYAISQYCNELVSDGKGALEPRFSCNLVLNSRDEVYNVIQQMTSLFRGIAYYGAGSLVLLQDKPADSQYLLNPSNVIDGLFTYSGTSQKARHTVATVSWQSYDTLGEVEYEYVEDAESVAKYGIINKDVKAVGCYSQGQAHRLGKWLLLSELNLTETVTFAVSIDSGIVLRPGMVIDVADPTRAGTRRSGRVSSATTTSVTVDDNTSLAVNLANSPTLSVLMPTGLVETRGITGTVGTTISVASAFSQVPSPNNIWLIQTTDVQSQQFRVLTISEDQDGVYSVTAVEYNSSIYAAIESDLKLSRRDVSNLTDPPDAPTAITITEYLYEQNQSVFAAADVSWSSSGERVNEFRLNYRIDNDNWTQIITTSPNVKILNVRPGTLYIEVQAYNFVGKGSAIAAAQQLLLGKTAPPGNVQNLSFEAISYNSGRLRWTQTVDLDVKTGGRVHIRHNSKTDGTGTWADSVDLIPAKSGASTEAIVPLIEGEILVKFEDDGGKQSVSEASVIIDLPDTVAPLLVSSRREDGDVPPFQGERNGVFYDSTLDALLLETDELIDDVPDIDAMASFGITGNILPSGSYNFANTLDLGSVFSLDLSRYFVTRGVYLSDLIDLRNAFIDDWTDFDGTIPDKVNAKLLLRSTEREYLGTYTQSGTTVTVNVPAHGYAPGDTIPVNIKTGTALGGTYTVTTASTDSLTYTATTNLSTSGSIELTGGITWTAYQEFVAGTFKGRAFQFKAELSSAAPDQNIYVDELGYEATFQRRVEHSNGLVTTANTAYTVNFAHAFWTGTAALSGSSTTYLPSIGITAQNMASGDYFTISDVTGSSFVVTFKNSSNTPISRAFNWSAVGYGKAG